MADLGPRLRSGCGKHSRLAEPVKAKPSTALRVLPVRSLARICLTACSGAPSHMRSTTLKNLQLSGMALPCSNVGTQTIIYDTGSSKVIIKPGKDALVFG